MARKWFIFVLGYERLIVCDGKTQGNLPGFGVLPAQHVQQFYLNQIHEWAKKATPGDFLQIQGQPWTLFCVNKHQSTHLTGEDAREAVYDAADRITKTLPQGHGTLPSVIVGNAANNLAAWGVVPPGYDPQTDNWPLED